MVQLFRTDLQFLLDQILLAESGQLPPTAFHPWGLRTVSGVRNHIIPGQETWGSSDQNFPRLLTPVFRDADAVTFDPDGPGGQAVGNATSYQQVRGFVFDSDPRLISNLIVDQTPNNPAAVAAAGLAGTTSISALNAALAAAQAASANEADDVPPAQAVLNAANGNSTAAAAAAAAAQAQAAAHAATAAAATAAAATAAANAAGALAVLNALLNADVTAEALAQAQSNYNAAVTASNAADAAAALAGTTAAASATAAANAAAAAATAASGATAAQAVVNTAAADAAAAQTVRDDAAADAADASANLASLNAAATTAANALTTAQAALTTANANLTAANAAVAATELDATTAANQAAAASAAEAEALAVRDAAQAALDALVTQAEMDAASAILGQRQVELTAASTASSNADAAAATAVSAAATAAADAAAAATALATAQTAFNSAQTAATSANNALTTAQALVTAFATAAAIMDANLVAANAAATLAAQNAQAAQNVEDLALTAFNDAQAALDAATPEQVVAATQLRDQRQTELTAAIQASNQADSALVTANQTAANAAASAAMTAGLLANAQTQAGLAQTNATNAAGVLATAQVTLALAVEDKAEADAELLAANALVTSTADAAATAAANEAAAQSAFDAAQAVVDALALAGVATQQQLDEASAALAQAQADLELAIDASNLADTAAALAAQEAADAAAAAALAAAAVTTAQSNANTAQDAAEAAATAAAAAVLVLAQVNGLLTAAQDDLDAANLALTNAQAELADANDASAAAQTAAAASAAQAAADAAAVTALQQAAVNAAAAEQAMLDTLTALQNADVPQSAINAVQAAYDAAALAAANASALAVAAQGTAAASAATAAALGADAATAAANAAAALAAYNAAVQEAATAAANVTAAQDALDAALVGSPIVQTPGLDGVFGTADDRDVFFIPNTAPDEGLSAPFNSWFTLFGQFFDHGLDLVNKGGSGTVVIPLLPDDPLYNPLSPNTNFMVLTRATNDPGADGILGTPDDIHEHNNQTTPFVDQNQTYTSHASHQVFLREYAFSVDGPDAGTVPDSRAVATGRFLDGAQGGLATWADVKAQSAEKLGILLSDHDVLNIPLLLTDDFGRFIPGTNGFAQVAVRVSNGSDGLAGTADDTIVFVQGVAGGLDINSPAAIAAALAAAGSAITTGQVVRIDHAFLDDIAHGAAPGTWNHDNNPATPAIRQTADADDVASVDDGLPGTYDDELLEAHYITGDGRGNENIGLTAVHTIFHAEHNRLVEAIKAEILAINDPTFTAGWLKPGVNTADGIQALEWNGERLFQAAKVLTEMQYQHLVFEEFARKIQPNVDLFINIDMTINPAIFAEFAHVVYRFGHSMLTETVDRFDANFNVIGDGNPTAEGNQQIGLIAAFLNPLEFAASGVDAADATAAIIRGMTRQQGNAIDEFVTDALRSNLVGLPLDLAALNIARGRDTGVPGLNDARRQFYAATGDAQLKPYTSWIDFAQHVKHPASVINFIAAYGTHALITGETTMEGKRAAATAIVTGADQVLANGRIIHAPSNADALAFLNATGAYATLLGGLDSVDLWIGGLAEAAPAFGGMLGSTFAFVFETQMEALQNGDRFYYLARFSGQNFLSELEGNSFASLIMRNTDLKHLPGDVFSTPNWTLEVNQSLQFTDLGADRKADPTYADEDATPNQFTPLVSRDNPNTDGPDTNYLRYNGGGHVVLGGTEGADILIGGIGDDTLWGDGGNDRLEGGNGFDIINGGDGDDIITDLAFDDNIKGGDGNDVIHSGNGLDLVIAGRGNDFVNIGEDEGEVFGGLGDDFLTHDGILAGLVGGFGNDWLEGGAGIGTLTGDNADVDGSALNFGNEDPNGGHDVIIGSGAPNDHDAMGGDDIMVGGQGTDRFEGFIGFDWVGYQNNTLFGANADMFIRAFDPPPLPGDPGATLDRFDATEGLSGSMLGDVLLGDDRNPNAGVEAELTTIGHELTAAGIARINGLADLLGPGITFFNGGNIILGGGGSDLIQGRGGNDIIDGDAMLRVAIGVDRNKDGDFLDANERVYSMREIQAEMLSGAVNPGQLGIIREIIVSPTTDTDTAVYSGNRAAYFIEGQDSFQGIHDQDGDGFIRVAHLLLDNAGAVVLGGIGLDGVDLVRNIERLQFNDVTLNVGETPNLLPTGLPIISDTTPTEGQTITVNVAGIRDPNNLSTAGVITGPISITWQEDDGNGVWTDIMVPGPLGTEGPVPAVGPSYTVRPEQAAHALRVRYQFIDENGVLETVFSNETAAVLALNDLPVGTVAISDPTPTQGDLLTAIIAFNDADGTDGAVFAFQWESSLNGTVWTPIAGATNELFSPALAQVGRFVRVVVTYTDDAGFNERVESAPTALVGRFFTGGNGGDNFTGTAQADRIQGLGGADTLNGAGGDDIIEGGAGGDTLSGGDGNDLLFGDAANDTLNGGIGNDTLTGGAGVDQLNGGDGNDRFVYAVGDGNDVVNGNAGTDTFALSAGAGNQSIAATFNGTRLTSLSGVSLTNIESVTADLGAGTDTLNYGASTSAVTVNLATGVASGFTSIVNIENVTGGSGNDTITGNGGANVLSGGGGQDTINGGIGADTIDGGDANDILIGGAGDDTITGGDGVDRITGSEGNDILNGNNGNDIFVFAAGFGADRITGFDENPGGGGQDLLDISAFGITAATFASNVTIAASGANVLITVGGQTITLLAEAVGGINASDFILA